MKLKPLKYITSSNRHFLSIYKDIFNININIFNKQKMGLKINLILTITYVALKHESSFSEALVAFYK